MYFGIAHLLDYPAPYDKPLYRFADFNAGHYASRNAAFQNALSVASGMPLALDGDLLRHVRPTRRVARPRRAAARWPAASDLSESGDPARPRTRRRAECARAHELYQRVFALAERLDGRALPRAVLPHIDLQSPKITRKLTTEWFANRVDERHRRCMARIGAPRDL